MHTDNFIPFLKVGLNIKKMREFRNYTQEYMAEALKISQAAYSKIEKENADLGLRRLYEIANILNVKISDIIDFNEKIIFNFSENQGNSSNGFVINNSSEISVKELYERLLESKEQQIIELKEIISFLKNQ
jgi:transcriptional regulator with XRE-family HTH domain